MSFPTLRRQARHRRPFRRLPRAALALLLTAGLLSVGSVVTPATAAPGDRFDETAPTVLVAQGSVPGVGSSPTQLSRAETSGDGDFTFTDEGPALGGGRYNAIGFKPTGSPLGGDGFIYGMSTTAIGSIPGNALVRVGQEGDVTRVGSTVYPGSAYFTGAVNPDNGLYYTTNTQRLLALDPVTGAVVTNEPYDANGPSIADFTYLDGYFWALFGNNSLVRVDPATGDTVSVPLGIAGAPSGTYGAAWTFGNGNLGFSNNPTGTILQLRITDTGADDGTPAFEFVSSAGGPDSSSNDGTSIEGLPADLSILKAGPASFAPGGQIEYQITVTNNGDGVSSGYSLSDTLPTGLSNVSTDSATCVVDGLDLSCGGARLAAGDSRTITVTANTDPGITDCLVNTVTVLGNEADNTPDNNTSTAQSCPGLLDVTKSVSPAAGTTVAAGDTLTYTLSFANPGEVPSAVDYTDYLTGIIDDADLLGDPQVTVDGEGLTADVVDGNRIVTTGSLPAGETTTVEYTVEVLPDGERGDNSLQNIAVPTGNTPPPTTCDPDVIACTVNPISQITVDKSVDPASGASVAAGDDLTYTISIANEGNGQGEVAFDDVLTGLLDDTVDNALTSGPTAEPAGPLTVSPVDDERFTIRGALGPDESVDITYVATVGPDGERGDDILGNAVVGPDEDPPGPDEECAPGRCTSNPVSQIEAVKSVSPDSGSTVEAGDELTYTLTFSNEGAGDGAVDYTDYLGGVLDDAQIVDGPTATDGLTADLDAGNNLQIGGTLAAGTEGATVTYTVEVLPEAARENDVLGNFLVAGDDPPPGTCDPDSTLCTTNPVAEVVATKSVEPASGTAVDPGEELTYTLTFTNEANGTGTVDHTDLLAGILDDATLDEDGITTTGDLDAALEDDTLVVTGSVSDTPVTVSYTVTVGADGDRGDSVLSNFLVPEGEEPPAECVDGNPACTTNPVSSFSVTKTVTPTDGSTVEAGEELDYTLTFANDGGQGEAVDYTDDVSGVLDDADVTDPAPSSDDVTVTADGQTFVLTGEVPAGETVTVTYTATVNPDGERGDDVLGNFLVVTGETPPDVCEPGNALCTTNPVSALDVTKTVDAPDPVVAGSELTYTLRFENQGQGDAEVDVTDDLTYLVDDAEVTTAPTSDQLDVETASDGASFRITGTVGPGADNAVEISYVVTLRPDGERGDDNAANFALVGDPEDPDTPTLPDDPGDPGACGQQPCTSTPIGQLDVDKSVDAGDEPLVPGSELTYTLTFDSVGTGPVDVSYFDDLRGVLDDAELTDGPAASVDSLSVTSDDGVLTIDGRLDADETVTVTYTVTLNEVDDRGDNVAANFLTADPPGDEPRDPQDCVDGSDLCTTTPLPALTDTKSVDPVSGSPVTEGQLLTYTLTFTNEGGATAPVDRVDDLTLLLDDARVVDLPDASDLALEVSPIEDGRFAITGEVGAEETITVTYTVEVGAAGERGDDVLANFLLDPDDPTPTDPTCAEGSQDCTSNPVGQITVEKSSDPGSGSTLSDGDRVTYTLDFANTGQGAADVDFVDHLDGVLDDAELVDGPQVSGADLQAQVDGDTLAITGTLGAGESAAVSYVVEIDAGRDGGDNEAVNFVTAAGVEPPEECLADSPLCTSSPIEVADESGLLPDTGSSLTWAVLGAALLALLSGLAVMVTGRRSRA